MIFFNNDLDPEGNQFSELYPLLEDDDTSQYYDSKLFKSSKPSSSIKDF